MSGMRCAGCGHVGQYFRPVVVVRDGLATVVTEGTPHRNEVGVRRSHERCYETAGKADPSLPGVAG
ncbi:MAG: hypothetical protein JSU06_02420 [Actinobacteria bacterium]|nr:hypothetical protein [Actinomycetota bacterium]